MDANKNNTAIIIPAAVIGIAWVIFFYAGISSAVSIWYGNEIFNHGFLILPAVAYFAYIKRGLWLSLPLHTTNLALPFIVGGIVLYVVGYAGDIRLFMHAAAFGTLPFLIWMLIGHRASYQLIFPLFFVVFAIPVGEQLVPWLQEVTADISVYMLQMSGIPLFRSGLYIEIPQGRFLVAEACSGISFTIASIVVGCVYSYLNFVSTKKRIGFVILSIVYPIIANAIRVYGIIMVGYLSDMEHAVGADHLIYGWFFFAIVLISLLAIGEWIRDKDAPWDMPLGVNHTATFNISKVTVSIAVAAFALGLVWMNWIASAQKSNALLSPTFLSVQGQHTIIDEAALIDYKPALNNPGQTKIARVNLGNSNSGMVYQAWFDGQNNELISGLHRLYDENEWTLVRQIGLQNLAINNLNARLVSDPVGRKRLVASWYIVNSNVFVRDTPTKLYQTGQVLLGEGAAGLRVIATVPVLTEDNAEDDAITSLESLINALAPIEP